MITDATKETSSYFRFYKLNDNSIIDLIFFDTTGQEKYRALVNTFCNTVDGIILTFDITNRKSFDECKNYYCKIIKEKCINNIKVILLGNKIDLEGKREISPQEGADLALKNDYIFMETSCLKNENVIEVFETIIETTFNEKMKNENYKGNCNLI